MIVLGFLVLFLTLATTKELLITGNCARSSSQPTNHDFWSMYSTSSYPANIFLHLNLTSNKLQPVMLWSM